HGTRGPGRSWKRHRITPVWGSWKVFLGSFQAAAHGPNVVSVDDVFVVEQLRDLDDGNSQQENAGIGAGVLCDQQVERGGSDRQVEQPAQPAVQIEMVRSEQEKPVEQRIG